GVIHRDLKPDNVLVREVDGVPQPKIIDFGIAIGDSAASATVHYDRAGTATYMSPEQASRTRRDIDTRSDVYSLGVMLFEVLTDFDASATTGASFHSGAQLRTTLLDDTEVAESVPETLLAAAHSLPRELRAVLRRALAPNREDRYDSAAALAEDLQRYAERRPLKALPATRRYLARKFVSRHRLGLSAATLAGLALIVGIVLALAAEHRAEAAAARAEQVSKFIGDILVSVDPDQAKGMDTRLLRKLLEQAGQRANTELASQPEARMHIQGIIADSYVSIGDYRLAARYGEQMLKNLDAVKMDDIDKAYRLAGIVRLFNVSEQAKRALSVGRRALALSATAPVDDPHRLRVEEELAWAESNSGLLKQALQRFEQAYAIRLRADPADNRAIESDMRAIGTNASDLGDYGRAEAIYTQLLARLQARVGDDNSNTINAANELAIVYLRQKHYAKAETLLRAWLPRATRLLGADHPTRMSLFSNLGGAIRQQGRNEEARPYYEKTLAYALAKFGPDHSSAVVAESNLSFLLRDAGDLAAAEQHARAAVDHLDAAFGKGNGYQAVFYDALGTILVKEKRYAEAGKVFDHAWAMATGDADFGPDHPLTQELVQHAIDLYTTWGKPGQAALWQQRRVNKATSGSE
ncbi:MAG TPA: tetratricopeptide repeat-containing protein kinase family protein, partial [Rhodanobacteraceae bacterium]|nr:tetratricopeptide repeat-containing protein kinase family protein [Rhodanobacteraceae bacterium]